MFPVQPQNNGLLLRGLSDKDAWDNPEHQPNTGKHQEERKNLEIKSEQMPWDDNTAETSHLSTWIKQCFL